jgi:hypothetical protein
MREGHGAPTYDPGMSEVDRDALAAGLVAAVVSGIPSTAWAVARRRDVLAAAKAAGTLVLPRERRTVPLLLAAVPVHAALSIGWAGTLARILPRERELLSGGAAGLAIAALDLGVIGSRFPGIRDLEQVPQWLDHVAYGLTVGAMLRARRRARDPHHYPASALRQRRRARP